MLGTVADLRHTHLDKGQRVTRLATWLVAILIGLCFTCGCNNSRYGISYDNRLPQLKRVDLCSLGVEVQSLHSGGALEARPDLVEPARNGVLGAIKKLLAEKGFEAQLSSSAVEYPPSDEVAPQALALARAVQEEIIIHHYEYGSARVIDYHLGHAAHALASEDSDAALGFYLRAVVPTGSRQGLAVTAAVIGVITGIHVHVKTNEVALVLMLVDRETGEVLWFNWRVEEMDIRSERGLRKLVERTSKFLLEPRKQ